MRCMIFTYADSDWNWGYTRACMNSANSEATNHWCGDERDKDPGSPRESIDTTEAQCTVVGPSGYVGSLGFLDL